MRKLYHLYNSDFEIIEAQYFEEGTQPENAVYIDFCNFKKPMFNPTTSEVYEGATTEEIAEQQQQQQIEQTKLFLQANKEAGESYYNEINLRVTMALIAVERTTLFQILQEVDTLLYPPLNKIKTGDFASALFIFENQTPPLNQFVLNFYNEAVQYCQNYYDTKYPK
jgi:hypothetical protein